MGNPSPIADGMERVNQAIESGRDLDEVLAGILDVTIELLHCDRALLLFPCDPEAPEYTPRLERRRAPTVRELFDGNPIPRSESTAGMFRLALASDRPIGFGPGSEEPLPADVTDRIGVRSLLGTAVRPRTGPPWAFVVHQCDQPRPWSDDERDLLRDIGRRLSDNLSTLLGARELARSEAMYRRLVDTSHEGIWALDASGVATFVNERMAQLLGRPIDEIVGRPAAAFLFDEDIPDHVRRLEQRRTGGPPEYDRRFRRSDGTEVWTHLSVSTLLDDDGEFAGVFAMVTDIGDRRRAEEELRQSEERFATAFRMSPDLLILTRRSDGVILEVNDALEPMLGYTRDQAIGTTTASLGAWATDHDRTGFLAALAEHGEVRSVETLLRRADGSLVVASTSGRILTVNGEPCLLSVVRDMTEQRLAEQRIRESEAKYRSLIEHLPDPVLRIDADLRRTYVNPAWEEETGVDARRAIGSSVRSGTTVALAEHVQRVLDTGEAADPELDITLPNGARRRVRYSLAPERDDDGAVTSVLAVCQDVTERHRAEELRIAQQIAEQASRAKSAFIASMSHEIRTPMNAILGFAQLLRADPTLDARQRDQVEIIHRSGEHLVDLVNDVLELSRIEAGRSVVSLAPFDLHALLAEVETLLAPRAAAKALTLRVHRMIHVPQHVVSDEGKVRQILINLVGNAVKFTSVGRIDVRVDHIGGEHADAEQPDAGRLLVEVEDTGRGIAAEDQPRLFGYFEQAGRPDDGDPGTGLGLAISRGFARLLGGDLTVRSDLGRGSTFRCEIDAPVAGPGAVRSEAGERRVLRLAPGRPAHRILVADDSAANRELLCEILEQVGFVARAAVDGQQAVDLFAEWAPDLVLMDMRMPVLDGREATERIRALRSDAKVVAVTADVFLAEPQTARAAGMDAVLTKPFRMATLFDVVGTVLDVAYTYDDGPSSPHEPARAHDGEGVARLALATGAVDAAARDRLHRAAEELDFDEVVSIADDLPEPLAGWLRARAQDFDANAILAALAQH